MLVEEVTRSARSTSGEGDLTRSTRSSACATGTADSEIASRTGINTYSINMEIFEGLSLETRSAGVEIRACEARRHTCVTCVGI